MSSKTLIWIGCIAASIVVTGFIIAVMSLFPPSENDKKVPAESGALAQLCLQNGGVPRIDRDFKSFYRGCDFAPTASFSLGKAQ